MDPSKDALVPLRQRHGFSDGVVALWRRKHGGKPGGFVQSQLGGGFAEMVTGGGFRAVHSAPPFGHIQIQFKDTLLGQVVLERSSNQGLVLFESANALKISTGFWPIAV